MPSEPVADPASDSMMLVFVDGCAVNRFALINVDPAKALFGSGLTLAVTADLEAEYRRALDHLFVPSYVKALLRSVLGEARRIDRPGAALSTDATLAHLAQTTLVITDDRRLSGLSAAPAGLVAWSAIEDQLREGTTLPDILRRRAAPMGHARSLPISDMDAAPSSSCSDRRRD